MDKNSNALETRDLTKVYLMGTIKVYALRGVNLQIKRGELVAIVGPSGSGKSTLLNLLGLLDKPTSGKIIVGNRDVSTLNDAEASRFRNEKIGFVFQSFNLINRSTALKNVELPALVRKVPDVERRKRAEQLLRLVGLEDRIHAKPIQLSGGEQQRVAIARALMNEPEIILADEPTGNLDSQTGREIFRLLKKLNRERGATIVVVTHNLELAGETDRIVRLRDGKVEEDDS